MAYKPLINNPNGQTTIRKSSDAGNNWTTISSTLNFPTFTNSDRYVFCVSPTDPNTMYIGDYNVLKSTNGGLSFTSTSSMHVDIRRLHFLSDNQYPDIFCVGNDGGIIKTTDGGSSYVSKCGSGLSITQFHGMGISSVEDIAGGTLDNDVLIRTNGNWGTVLPFADAADQMFDPTNPNIFYSQRLPAWVGGASYEFYKYTFSNGNWSYGSNLAPPDNFAQIVRPWDLVNGQLYIGYHDVYKSPTPNISWTKISHFSTDFSQVSADKALTGLAVSHSNPNIIYATYSGWLFGNSYPTFFKTIDGGVTWSNLTNYLPTSAAVLEISKIIVDPSNPLNVWITLGGIKKIYGSSGNSNGEWRVIKSSDGGSTWVDYSTNLPEFPVNSIIYQKGSDGGLYVGTDVGVYYTNNLIYNSSGWICYNKDLPVVMVTDLDIDYCTGKLYASTFGRGIWQCELLTIYPQSPPPQHIYSNTTISSPILQETDIIVEPSATLTINSQINFEPFAGIIVKPNATLILNGGTLTSACKGLWKGIEVWGDKNSSQYLVNNSRSQGFVQLNGGTIENALYAIRLWQPGYYSTTGGIVQANGTTFRNNILGVEFQPYHNFNPFNNHPSNNFSFFNQCQFLTNSNFIGPNTFWGFIALFDVEGINFKGCTFQNSTNLSSDPNPPSRGRGIASMTSSFSVSSLCTSTYSPCPPPPATIPTVFQGLSFGIYGASSGSSKSIRVVDASFIDNDRGVYLSGVNNSTVVNNNFKIGTDNTCPNQTGIGVELVNSSGYSVEDNYFTHSTTLPTGNWYIGICIKYGDYYSISNNEIYGNTCEEINVGNQAEGFNYDPWNIRGLSYYCNINNSNNYDFYVPGEGILMFQGTNSVPAGNKFSHNYDPNIPGSDFTRTAGWPVFYYYYNNSVGSKEQPFYYNNNVIPNGTGNQNQCLSHYNGSGNQMMLLTQHQIDSLTQEFANNSIAYDNIFAIYESLKDGGSTSATSLDVISATPDQTMSIRTELLGKSPHLSEEVLKNAIDKFDVLPDAILLEILSANPDELRDERLMNYLRERVPPFPDYMVDILSTLSSDTTYKTTLLQTLSYYNSKRIRAAYEIIRNAINDSAVDMTFIRNWLDNLHNLNADYQIIDSWFQEDNSTSAMSLLDMLPTIYNLSDTSLTEYTYFKDLKTLQASLIASGNNILQMNSDQIVILENIASMSKGIAGTQARNILEFGYGYVYPQCPAMVSPTTSKSIKSNISELLNKIYEPKVKTFPNPANNWTAFYYELPDGMKNATIEITDANGHNVKLFMITNQKGQIIWDTREVITGSYLYTCKWDKYVKTGKLTIVH